MKKRISGGIVVIGALALGACGGDNKNTAAAGSSGAFGIVTVNGKQKLYLPQTTTDVSGNSHITVVDVGVGGNGVNGAAAQLADINLGDGNYATTTGGDATVIVAASTDNPFVRLIDPTHDTLKKTIQLDSSFGQSSFSGGGGYVTGIAMDSAHHRAILSVWNGFALLDTTAGTITKVIEAPPSENFGFDSVHQRIIAPFYECANSFNSSGAPTFCSSYPSEGLNVIDLADDTVYQYQNSAPPSPATADAPVGGEPDSAAVDPNTQVAMIASESGSWQNVIDLSQASFNKSAKTVTAPQKIVENSPTTGVAIEQSAHFAFLEEEGSSEVGLIDVGAANDGHGQFLAASMPDIPGGQGGWGNLGDPHGIAVTTAINDGKPVGFVVEGSRRWVARIDLEKMKSLDDGTGNVPDLSAAVTFLDGQSHE